MRASALEEAGEEKQNKGHSDSEESVKSTASSIGDCRPT